MYWHSAWDTLVNWNCCEKPRIPATTTLLQTNFPITWFAWTWNAKAPSQEIWLLLSPSRGKKLFAKVDSIFTQKNYKELFIFVDWTENMVINVSVDFKLLSKEKLCPINLSFLLSQFNSLPIFLYLKSLFHFIRKR